MALDTTHECSACEDRLKDDECFCKSCKEGYASDAYSDGKKVGYDEGYDAAQEEFEKRKDKSQ